MFCLRHLFSDLGIPIKKIPLLVDCVKWICHVSLCVNIRWIALESIGRPIHMHISLVILLYTCPTLLEDSYPLGYNYFFKKNNKMDSHFASFLKTWDCDMTLWHAIFDITSGRLVMLSTTLCCCLTKKYYRLYITTSLLTQAQLINLNT